MKRDQPHRKWTGHYGDPGHFCFRVPLLFPVRCSSAAHRPRSVAQALRSSRSVRPPTEPAVATDAAWGRRSLLISATISDYASPLHGRGSHNKLRLPPGSRNHCRHNRLGDSFRARRKTAPAEQTSHCLQGTTIIQTPARKRIIPSNPRLHSR